MPAAPGIRQKNLTGISLYKINISKKIDSFHINFHQNFVPKILDAFVLKNRSEYCRNTVPLLFAFGQNSMILYPNS